MANYDNPELKEYMDLLMAQQMFQARTVIAARVVSYKSDPRPMVTVQLAPQFRKRPNAQGEVEWSSFPQLVDVPVMEFAWGPFQLRAELEQGDDGVCLIHDSDIDQWLLEGGGEYRPGLPLIHDVNDALFLPMIQPDRQAGARKRSGRRKLIIGDSTGEKCEIELDEVGSRINIKAAISCRVDSPAVTLGESTGVPVNPIARVTTDYVLMPIIPPTGVPTATPLPILPGPFPTGTPSNHKVAG
jgi:hypothetical protein